jgi:2-methylisocitrate lyase-like PEP mutase family enzyme
MEKVINHLSQHRLAENFHALHHQQQTLLLINAWDCASAKMIEAAGLPAIATSSAGLAWSLGFADGEKILPEVHLEALKEFAIRFRFRYRPI